MDTLEPTQLLVALVADALKQEGVDTIITGARLDLETRVAAIAVIAANGYLKTPKS